MGYTTEFKGRFALSSPLSEEQEQKLRAFADECHATSEGPGGYCQWVPSPDRAGIEWDGNEKFYDYSAWLSYLIERFFAPWGLVLTGEVQWQGEEVGDIGILSVKDNVVSTRDLVPTRTDGSVDGWRCGCGVFVPGLDPRAAWGRCENCSARSWKPATATFSDREVPHG